MSMFTEIYSPLKAMKIVKTDKAGVTLSFLSFLSFFLVPGHALSPHGTIERSTKQQELASLPPSHETMPTSGSSQLFLNSPSGNYAAFLVRRETPIGGVDIGSDFCYILVQKAGHSIWESECTSVSNVNTCTLVFSDAGLEIFDGSHSAWDTGADEEHLQTLDLLDGGDMEIRDQDGKLVWKASDDPLVNRNCGFTGASGLALGHAPFSSNEQPLSGYNQPFSYNNQPFGANNQQGLVDSTAIDSGISGVKKFNFGVTLISLISLMAAFRFLV